MSRKKKKVDPCEEGHDLGDEFNYANCGPVRKCKRCGAIIKEVVFSIPVKKRRKHFVLSQ